MLWLFKFILRDALVAELQNPGSHTVGCNYPPTDLLPSNQSPASSHTLPKSIQSTLQRWKPRRVGAVKTWPLFRVGLGISIREQELSVNMMKEDKNYSTILAFNLITAFGFCVHWNAHARKWKNLKQERVGVTKSIVKVMHFCKCQMSLLRILIILCPDTNRAWLGAFM